MLFPIKQLIEGHDKPLCVTKETKVKDALALMKEFEYSQLPVVDDKGNLIGIITEQSIISMYYHTSGVVSLLDLCIDHCQTSPTTIIPEADIFEALGMLKNVYAIVVVQDKKPVGIVTAYDTTQFFQNISGGLILVEDIEVTLRQYIEKIIPEEKTLKAALIKAFGTDKRDPTEPAQKYEELTLGGYIRLITTDGNWSKFEPYFKPKELFSELLNQVRQIRNQLSHFRGRLEPIQQDALVRARDWLSGRPKVAVTLEIQSATHIQIADSITLIITSDKYAPLHDWLQKIKFGVNNVKLTFVDIEKIIGDQLTPSARDHRSWWDNDPTTHVQALSWVSAGWLVDDVDLNIDEVTFRQTNLALYYTFFSDLLARLISTRPGITQTRKASFQNWLSFSSGTAGFAFGWVLPKEHILRVELYINKGDKVVNKAAFEALMEQRIKIESEIGEKLIWSRLEKAKASRIYASIPFHITQSPEEHEKAKRWGLEMMLKFIDTFQPMLREL